LSELLRPSEIVVLATEDAESDHAQGLKDELHAGNQPEPRFERIPAGRREGELWQQFNVIKEVLRGSNGPVALDITHGFRSQPFFAAAVAVFVHAIDETPPELRVFYGAYDPRYPELGAPILELSEFVALLDWSRALAMFLRTGRAEEAAALTGKPGSKSEPLRKLSEAMKAFSLDLQTLRTGNLLIEKNGNQSSAIRLLGAVQAAKNAASGHLPPLAEVLDDVVKMVEPLASHQQDLSGADGHKAVSALAHLYLKIGRYLEAAVTIREGRINKFASGKALRPGARDFSKNQRSKAEEGAAKSNSNSETKEIKAIRNDMSHAQYVKSPKSASEIISAVERAVSVFSEDRPSQQHTECVSASDQHGACFVNLSNHPSAKWDETQTKAAREFAERIEDIAFPAVPPDADEKAIEALAEECVAQVPPETSHALVQGEFTLTVELVRRLQARGITCLAATSKRNVEEGCNGRRVSTFTFVRFRAYPAFRQE
jgi:CRISPR-associated protein Csx16